jgi:N-acylneuraminate cytidylyltransferase
VNDAIRMNKPRTIAFIFARGGSKGLPGKNLKALAAKPLIAHAIDIAKSIKEIETVIVSTDTPQIAEVAREFGAETPFMRPPELSTDNASELLAWRHAIEMFEVERGQFDIFVSVPATAPLRNASDVQACIRCLVDHPETDLIVTGTKASRSPYFNMVKQNRDGTVEIATPSPGIVTRQQSPNLFDLTTVAYVARPNYIRSCTSLLAGNIRLVEVPPERAIDIDTPLDFEIAEFLATRKT